MEHLKGEKFQIISELIKKSNDIPRKLQIQAFLETIENEELPYSVYVDKWPQWDIVIAKPKEDICLKIPVYKMGIYCKSQNWKNLKYMMCNTGFLPPGRNIWIYGLPMELIPAIKATALFLSDIVSFISLDEARYCMGFPVAKYPSLEDVEDFIQLGEKMQVKDFYVANLDADKHLDIIVSSWKTHNFHDFFIDEHEGREVVSYILSFKHMNFGIFKISDNELAAWYLSDVNGSGLMRYTLPKYRGLSLANWTVIIALVNMVKRNRTCYFGYLTETSLYPSIFDGAITHTEVPCVHCVMRPNKSML